MTKTLKDYLFGALASGAFACALVLWPADPATAALALNGRGQVAAGYGGSIVSLDGREIARPAGGAAWSTDDILVYQVCDAATGNVCQIESYDQRTGTKHTEATRGANELAAGGGVWAAWLDGVGLFASDGFALPAAGLRAVSNNGAIAYVPHRQSGLGVWVHEHIITQPRQEDWQLTPEEAEDVQVFGVGQGLWTHQHEVHTAALPPLVTLPQVYRPRAAQLLGEWWIAYWEAAGRRLVVHPFAETRGYTLNVGDDAFGVDMRVVDNALVVEWARNVGEAPTSLARVVVDTKQPRTELRITTAPTPAPPPTPAPTPTPVSTPALPAALCDRLRALRAAYGPTMQDAEVGPMLDSAVFPFGPQWGLSGKKGGHACPSPAGLIACDIVESRDGWMFDVLGDAGEGGKTLVGCPTDSIGQQQDASARPFVVAVDPGTGATPTPATPPTSAGPDPQIASLQQLVRNLQDSLQLAQHDAVIVAERDAQIAELNARLVASEAVVEQLRGQSVACVVHNNLLAARLGLKASCEVVR